MIRALLVAVASGVCLRLLTPHALAVLGSSAPTRVEDAVSQAATLTATGLTIWYLTTALVAVAAVTLHTLAGTRRPHLGRAARRASLALETAVRRFGAPMLRGGATFGLGLGLAVGAVPALATSQPSVEDVPADLRPGAVAVDADATPAATAPSPGPTTPAPALVGQVPGPAIPAPALVAQVPDRAAPALTAPTPTPAMPAPAAVAHVPTSVADVSAPATPTPTPEASAPTPTPGASTPPPTSASPPPDTPAPPARQPATPEHSGPSTAITVVDGDSLWRIAAAHLGPDADDAAIAREWPRWHGANAATIGPDPDLLHPGQVLHAPSTEVTP